MHVEKRERPYFTEEASPLKRLPTELLCCIFRKLDEKNLFALAHSCREIRALVLQVPEGKGVLKIIAKLYFSTLHSARIVSDFEVFAKLTGEMKRYGGELRSLELQGVLPQDSEILVQLCPALEKLNLCGELSLKELEGLKALKELTYEAETETILDLEKFPEALASRLESLKLKNMRPVYLEQFALKALFAQAPYLPGGEEASSPSSRLFKELKVLTIETSRQMESGSLRELLKRTPKLKKLKLSSLEEKGLKEESFLKSLNSSGVKTLHIQNPFGSRLLFAGRDEELELCRKLFEKTRLKRIILRGTPFERGLKRKREETPS